MSSRGAKINIKDRDLLTKNEALLYERLLRDRGNVVSHAELMAAIGGAVNAESNNAPGVLSTHISAIRRKKRVVIHVRPKESGFVLLEKGQSPQYLSPLAEVLYRGLWGRMEQLVEYTALHKILGTSKSGKLLKKKHISELVRKIRTVKKDVMVVCVRGRGYRLHKKKPCVKVCPHKLA